jgi:iron complex transport system ATP-binding protein
VLVNKQPLSRFSRQQLAQQFAFVPQNAVSGFGFPVRDVVAMGRTPYAGRFQPLNDADLEIIREAMSAVDVLPYADRRLTELSGGERQRVFLARALAQTTPILVFDEPVANLDPYHEIQILEQMQALAKQGKTVVCVLHNLSQAACYCDRLVVLSDGKVAAQGIPAEILTPALLADVFRVDGSLRQGPQSQLVIRGRLR